MKRTIVTSVMMVLMMIAATAQDTLYVHLKGGIVTEIPASQFDSITFYKTKSTDATVADVDGNVYKTVKIGTQTWFAENLKTTRYKDGTAIPNITNATEWIALTATGAYCTYNNTKNADTINTYGRFYNWYAVNTAKLCPSGWHVPTDAEWTTLSTYLTDNGYGYEGSGDDIGKAVASTSGWATDATAGNVGNNQASNNRSGFNGFPVGWRRYNNGNFDGSGTNGGNWWSSSEYNSTYAYYRDLDSYGSTLSRGYHYKQSGFSVRCIKN